MYSNEGQSDKDINPSLTVQIYINLTFVVESVLLLLKENLVINAQEVMKRKLDVFYLLYLEGALWNLFLITQKEIS